MGRTFEVTLRVNGVEHVVECDARDTLLQVLRARLGYTGPKYGCGIGYCGACTAIVDGRVGHSCCLLAATLDGADVTTVEGFASVDGDLDAVQRAMLEQGGVQCGYCTPGFVTTLHALLEEIPSPTQTDVEQWLLGNICRCTGFAGIVRAALQAGTPGTRPASDTAVGS